ncbi:MULTISPECIES: enolase [Stenotrophomonas]|uniref:Enolase n=1 Tax=Stenotrophomonas maltophilia TaxID=40324 RepID=A0A3S0KHI2_STEMA|nr:enolase [Stenotrophomonas maltophilia]RTQ91568.1 enolase [Stenotrophomonas maltophilia]
MQHYTDVRELLPGMTAFPEPAAAFSDDQPWLADHLLPLLAVDLGVLRPELAGTVVTLLCPIEPYEGCIGDDTQAWHTPFTSPNWLGFQLQADNRMRLLGQEGYFRRAPQHADSPLADEALRLHAEDMHRSHARTRAFFMQHGRLPNAMDSDDASVAGQAFLAHLGGPFQDGNWPDYERIPEALDLQYSQGSTLGEDAKIRIQRDGRDFFPVASVPAYDWCAAGADAILMFYEPHSRTVLFTFDWS